MEKFTDRQNESVQEPVKFFDKTKQEIYSLIKETVKANIEPSGEKMSQIEDAEISLTGVDELTDKLYNFVQKEKMKEEIVTLESIKTILVAGPFNFTKLNEQIEQLKKRLNEKV
jgi:ribosome-associated translation inhibitor RaiA